MLCNKTNFVFHLKNNDKSQIKNTCCYFLGFKFFSFFFNDKWNYLSYDYVDIEFEKFNKNISFKNMLEKTVDVVVLEKCLDKKLIYAGPSESLGETQLLNYHETALALDLNTQRKH
jgi:hypothetical protein